VHKARDPKKFKEAVAKCGEGAKKYAASVKKSKPALSKLVTKEIAAKCAQISKDLDALANGVKALIKQLKLVDKDWKKLKRDKSDDTLKSLARDAQNVSGLIPASFKGRRNDPVKEIAWVGDSAALTHTEADVFLKDHRYPRILDGIPKVITELEKFTK
jgi:septal ring factor EnvC (AmiA/AmiB activator)